MPTHPAALLALTAAATLLTACGQHRAHRPPAADAAEASAAAGNEPGTIIATAPTAPITEVFRSDGYQFTGVAISSAGRLFVNFPRWGGPYRMAVAEIRRDGTPVPFPNDGWNRTDPTPTIPGGPPDLRFICVQSVTVDDQDHLWVLDPASPNLAGVVRVGGGPKLVRFNLNDKDPASSAKVFYFDPVIAPDNSYLNDLRVDTRRGFAYITDSGRGGLVVLDLNTGLARRLLDNHPSVLSDANLVPVIEGRDLRNRQSGQVPQIHADGLALSPDAEYVYYQALTAKRLFRIPTAALRDAALSPDQVAAAVEDLGETVVTDGMQMDADGNLYFSALEMDAIVVRTPDGRLVTHARDIRLAWPDSFAIGPVRGPNPEPRRRPARTPAPQYLYVTTAQIHRTSNFSPNGSSPNQPYRIFRMPLHRAD